MTRVALDLGNKEDIKVLAATGWRRAMGYVPGEPNQGLVAEILGSPARMVGYDDSAWDKDVDIQDRLSVGFTFAWYRLKFTMPEEVKGQKVAGCRVFLETNVDNYGEVYVNGKIDRANGVITGNNTQKRVSVEDPAVPGGEHLVSILVGNGPLGEPVGAIFMRYAYLSFEESPPPAR